MKPTAVIVDVDGTLADVRDIRFHVDGSVTKTQANGRVRAVKNFDAFHAASEFVSANQQAIDFCVRHQQAGDEILIVTARMRKWEDVTTRFLKRETGAFFSWAKIYMRADGDNRRDYEVKKEILAAIREDYEVVAAIDDNPQVVLLWRSEGIPTEVVPGWDHDAAAKYAAIANQVDRRDEGLV